MRRRNGNGSHQLQDVTEKFRKGEQRLIKVLEEAGYLSEKERTEFLDQITHAMAQKRSSEVLATAHCLHNKMIRVLQASRGESTRRDSQELEVLMEVSRLIQNSTRHEEAFERLLDLVHQLIAYENATLFIKSRTSQQLTVGAVRGQMVDLIGGVQFELGPGFSSWVAKQKKPILLNELHRSVRNSGPQIGSFLSVPLIVQGDLIGVLNLSHPSNQFFTEDHLRILTLVAAQTASILQRILMYEEMSRLAITDELSGLYNRRHFQERLGDELARARRYGQAFSLLFIDIDHFKQVNDSCGHAVGDRILADFGKILRQWARVSDVLSRYGGEEFVAFLPMTDPGQALAAAERLRHLIEEHSFPRRKRLTISVGVSSYPEDGDSLADLLKKADSALYQAKKLGRNRIMGLSLGAA